MIKKWLAFGKITSHYITYLGSNKGNDPSVAICGRKFFGKSSVGLFKCGNCLRIVNN